MAETSFRLQRLDESNVVHVPDIFRSVYGDAFPVPHVYRPELLAQELWQGRLSGALAFDGSGQAAGYVSIFHSAPNVRLWEAGNLVVVPAFRRSDAGEAVRELRAQGFFFGGLAPRWFDADGLLLQRVFGYETEYDRTKLYSPVAKELLAYIREDRATIAAEIGGNA